MKSSNQKVKEVVVSPMQQGAMFADSIEKNGFKTTLLDSKGVPHTDTQSFQKVCNVLSSTASSQKIYDEARKAHHDHVGVVSLAILGTICEAQKACGDNKHLVKTLVSTALDHLEVKADISTSPKNEKGGSNPKYRASYATRKSEAISSLKVTQPKEHETLAQFVTRAKHMKKSVLEQDIARLAEEHRALKGLYAKADVKGGMSKATAKEIAEMLKPAFGAIQALAENLSVAIEAKTKAKK